MDQWNQPTTDRRTLRTTYHSYPEQHFIMCVTETVWCKNPKHDTKKKANPQDIPHKCEIKPQCPKQLPTLYYEYVGIGKENGNCENCHGTSTVGTPPKHKGNNDWDKRDNSASWKEVTQDVAEKWGEQTEEQTAEQTGEQTGKQTKA